MNHPHDQASTQRAARASARAVRRLVALASVALPGAAQAAEGLNLFPDPLVFVVNVVVLGLLIVPVNRLMLQPLMQLLAAREARTRGSLERAEDLASRAGDAESSIAERLGTAREDARARRAAIMEEAQSHERSLLAQARDAAAGEVAGVRTAIAAELEGARKALHDEARVLAREAATRILGRSL